MQSLALGPFPSKENKFQLEIGLLDKQQQVDIIFDFAKWKQSNNHFTDDQLDRYF
jgi:hypothetical protein